MTKILKVIGKITFVILLLSFAVAFFLYKQYWISFFTLALVLIFSRWDQVKKIIIGKEKVEIQIPEKVIEKQGQDNIDNK